MEEVVAKVYEYKGEKYVKILSNKELQIKPVGQKYLEGYKNGISMPQWLFEAIKKIEPIEEKKEEKEEKIELSKDKLKEVIRELIKEVLEEEKKGN